MAAPPCRPVPPAMMKVVMFDIVVKTSSSAHLVASVGSVPGVGFYLESSQRQR